MTARDVPSRTRHTAAVRLPGLSRAATVLLALPLLSGCGDLPLTGGGGRTMSSVRIELPDPIVVGDTVALRFRALDAQSEPFAQLPPWLSASWSLLDAGLVAGADPGADGAADSPVLGIDGDRAVGLGAGLATLRVEVGRFWATAAARVNPANMLVGIPGAYITQGVQRFDGTVPLVANRPGHMRVFVVGDQPNHFRPSVLVHFYRNGQRIETLRPSSTSAGIPQQLQEGVLAWSWNVRVPGELIRPGTSYRAEIDPEYRMRAAPASALAYPPSGRQALDVVVVPRFEITFVPIHIIGYATGNVTAANVEQYMAATRQVWPLDQVAVFVREPYSTSTQSATASDWSDLLREIRNLRIAEGSPRYYHGILRRQGAWAGLAYLGYPVGITYDALPAANWTVAHELGHNFGRLHAPCGNPSGVDSMYPYPDGSIGVYGMPSSGAALQPTSMRDLMSYCSPRWISDYNFEAALDFRTTRTGASAAGAAAPVPSLIVSGIIEADGAIRLDPAFRATTVPSLPAAPGPFTLDALDAAGARLFSLSFEGEALGHGPDGVRHFAFAVPLADDAAARLSRLRVQGRGRSAEAASSIGVAMRADLQRTGAPGLDVRARAAAPGRVALRWDAARHPLVVVRNADTGTIIGMLRGGDVTLDSDARELDLQLSDGVSSIGHRIRVEGR
jgi:hypothetical protein